MSLMTWNESMSVGVAQFDEEHKKLIALINELFEAVQAGRGRQAMGGVLDELVDYTNTHFSHEEYQLRTMGFPGYEDHRREHEILGKQVLDIQRKYHSGTTHMLSMELLNFLKKWLTEHIKGVDSLYVSFVNDRGLR